MPSTFPQDLSQVLLPPEQAAPVERVSFDLGAFTANTTVVKLALNFDRRAVIREIWFSATAIPNDADGDMFVDAIIYDASEVASDTIVNDFSAETLTPAFKAFQATMAAETAENERTVEPGDSLRFALVSNSAAIDTNANIIATVLFQVIQKFG